MTWFHKFLFVMLIFISFATFPSVILALDFKEIQVTDNQADDRYVDMATDASNKIHLVYQRESKIYYWNNVSTISGFEFLIATGTDPSIAIGPTGDVHIVFIDGGALKYTRKNNTNFIPIQTVLSDDVVTATDLAVDTDNVAHIAYGSNGIWGYASIFYTHNQTGFFSDPATIFLGDFDGFGSWYYGNEYYNPSILVDSNNEYLVVVEDTYSWLDLDNDTSGEKYYLSYKQSNTGSKWLTPASESKIKLSSNPIVFDCSDTPYVVYTMGTTLNVRKRETTTTWNLLMTEDGGRNGVVDFQTLTPCNTFGITYVSGTSVSYLDNQGNRNVISSGSGPVLSYGIDSFINIAYPKAIGGDTEIFLSSTEKSVEPGLFTPAAIKLLLLNE